MGFLWCAAAVVVATCGMVGAHPTLDSAPSVEELYDDNRLADVTGAVELDLGDEQKYVETGGYAADEPHGAGWAWQHWAGIPIDQACDFASGALKNTDGSPGAPIRSNSTSSGGNYMPTDVADGSLHYANFGPPSNNAGGLNVYTGNSSSYYYHTFYGKILLEKGQQYTFAIMGQDGAKVWLADAGYHKTSGSFIVTNTGCKVSNGCASTICSDTEFDAHESVAIEGQGTWRHIRLFLAKGKTNAATHTAATGVASLKLRIKRGTTSLTVAQMNIRAGEASCSESGPDAHCSKKCSQQRAAAWGNHPLGFVDPDKSGKPIQGCRFYTKPCCTGNYTEFGPNDREASHDFGDRFMGKIQSMVCTEHYQTWMFKGAGNTGEAKFISGAAGTPRGVLACMKSTSVGSRVSDWSSSVKSTKVCEIATDTNAGAAHRRRRGVVNCAANGMQPEWAGWSWVHYANTGASCDFGGGTALTDGRPQVSSTVAMSNSTGCCSDGFTPTEFPSATGTTGASDHKYLSFDSNLGSYTTQGWMHEWRGQMMLEKDIDYTFAIRSDDGAKVWVEGATSNPVVEWNGCHTIGVGNAAFDEHESVAVKGQGKWTKIILYMASSTQDNLKHFLLRVKKGADVYLNATGMNVRHNVGE